MKYLFSQQVEILELLSAQQYSNNKANNILNPQEFYLGSFEKRKIKNNLIRFKLKYEYLDKRYFMFNKIIK